MIHSVGALLERYSAFIMAASCFFTVLASWETEQWTIKGILVAGAIICSFIGISDVKKYKPRRN
ncbi:hypothetical protein FQV26_01400 [Planococcus sp. CPCC 101016]|uniref:hypothetical protein n=1 Tax=Planococcus sp. CPCC 101016 TaxID=2599617 RepID=UPI0011B79275|nr:hypothetical protein [Planococcus sp. CPCC 101016]TWT06497.1 hypothetical protein FQV26_01400 [Planococcus sp. CPCC 101016]